MRKESKRFTGNLFVHSFILLLAGTMGCDLIQMKKALPVADMDRIPVARVNRAFLYKDELAGIVLPGTLREDSIVRVEAFVNSWIRKQLLIQEAAKKININEAEVERKILDYRYSLIAYEYQTFYVKQNLDTAVSAAEIEAYYKENLDNFILKQNIVRSAFIKVPKTAPRTNKIKDLLFSRRDKDHEELKSYCLSFSAAYHLADSSWMVFDELVKNSPLAEIPNKIQFLKTTPYFETSDDTYLYFFKVVEYRISDNISPLEFVRDDIRTIILNKRKVALARQLEDDVYANAVREKEFEVFKE
jgi:hypothetical protein